MTGVTAFTTLLFIVVVAVMTVLTGTALFRSLKAGGKSPLPVLAAFAVFYLILPAVLAAGGKLERYDPLPAPALLILMGLTLLTVITALSGVGARVSAAAPLSILVGFQVFRVAVEFLLHKMYLEGAVPVQMTYSGRNFDIISGTTGLLLGWWIGRTPTPSRPLVLLWNLLGLGLLINIVVVAVLSTPVSFRHFTEGPPNLLPNTFPFVWLPSFLVQLALFGHLLVFRRLRAPAS